jgi:hypothetical protein
MRRWRFTAGALFTFFYAGAQSPSFTLTYGFPNVSTTTGSVDPGPPPSVTGMVPATFTAFGVSLNPSASGRFSFTGWPLGSANGVDDPSQFAGSLSPYLYYEVSVTPAPGFTMQIQSIRFDVRRSGTGIRTYCVRSSVDGFTSNLAATTGTNSKLQVLPGDVFLWRFDSVSTAYDQRGSEASMPANSTLRSTLRLRIYAWNAESLGGSFSIDNFSIAGLAGDTTMLSGIAECYLRDCALRDFRGDISRGINEEADYEVSDLEGKIIRSFPRVFDPQLNLPPGIFLITVRCRHVTRVFRWISR